MHKFGKPSQELHVKTDIVSDDGAVANKISKLFRYFVFCWRIGNHFIADACNIGNLTRDWNLRIDECFISIIPFTVYKANRRNFGDPVALSIEAGCLEIERYKDLQIKAAEKFCELHQTPAKTLTTSLIRLGFLKTAFMKSFIRVRSSGGTASIASAMLSRSSSESLLVASLME